MHRSRGVNGRVLPLEVFQAGCQVPILLAKEPNEEALEVCG